MDFADSYVGQLRAKVGRELLLIPGARCVVLDATGRYLLELRRDFSMWGLLGGNAEPGEDISTTLTREIDEEAGLRVERMQPFGFASAPASESITFPNGDQCQFFVMLFVAYCDGDEHLRCSDESSDLAWFAEADLPMNMLPNMRRTIDAFLRFKDRGVFQLI